MRFMAGTGLCGTGWDIWVRGVSGLFLFFNFFMTHRESVGITTTNEPDDSQQNPLDS
jgi:hypothetical protein